MQWYAITCATAIILQITSWEGCWSLESISWLSNQWRVRRWRHWRLPSKTAELVKRRKVKTNLRPVLCCRSTCCLTSDTESQVRGNQRPSRKKDIELWPGSCLIQSQRRWEARVQSKTTPQPSQEQQTGQQVSSHGKHRRGKGSSSALNRLPKKAKTPEALEDSSEWLSFILFTRN